MVVNNSDESHEDISQISEHSGYCAKSDVKVKSQYELYIEIYEISSRQNIDSIIDSLYTDKERFYLFLSLVCKHVITRMRWKREKGVNSYYEFITESDEAFALMILDNNFQKYRGMVDFGSAHKDRWDTPKYTTIHYKNKMVSRRWCSKAKKRFFCLTEEIKEWRENNMNRMKELATYVLDKYKTCESQKKGSYLDTDEEALRFIKESMLSTTLNRKRKRKDKSENHYEV